MTTNTLCPSVFDAGLPTLDIRVHGDLPRTSTRGFGQRKRQAPMALGPYGPEILSHELVRTVLRDPRFPIPPGMTLMAHGITSGPLWDKIVNSLLGLEGDAHHRLRSLVSKAFTPGRARGCTTRSST